jgi:hypothetical protein
MKSFKPLVLPALSLLLASSLSAQTVYRCGNSYSQTPCSGAVTVPADDARSAAQRDAARKGLLRDQALAKEMEAARRAQEDLVWAQDKAALARTAAAPRQAGKKSVARKKAASAKPRTVKVKDTGVFTASDGVVTHHPKKTRRKTTKP